MKITLFTASLMITSVAIGQLLPPKETDTFAKNIEKNIFRSTLMIYEEAWPVTFSYEREIAKPFTIVLKAGPAFQYKDFGPAGNPNQYIINGFASGELRYYYNLKRRIRKQKAVRNFSASYFSLEQNMLTDPIIVINESRRNAGEGRGGTFLNIGYQKQSKKFYFNFFLGAKINVKEFKERTLDFDTWHTGIVIGIVLFE